jgi:BNR repeat-containing family member
MKNLLSRAVLTPLSCIAFASCAARSAPAPAASTHLSPIALGWARSSVNAVIFRQNSVVTHGQEQFAAFYDPEGRLVLAKRRLGTDAWTIRPTSFRGNVRDAHNAISIAVDGSGVLHVAWDHHGQPLNYARGVAPGSLELSGPQPQTGRMEGQVTYPGFYLLPDGDLLFLYRDGASGDGDVLLNRYRLEAGRWEAVQHPLIDGEGARNAYVNRLVVDPRGGWHLSWTWRESPDVASNHDVVYAFSPDEGRSWRRSTGETYALPITAATGEVAWRVPQGSELINQTSMAVDAAGRPVIATYWRAEGEEVPQFRLVWRDAEGWRMSQIGTRRTPFRLSGGGTKRIPVSRPQVIAGPSGEVHVIFRDEERGGGITVATSRSPDRNDWALRDVWEQPVGLWEPSHDPVAWRRDGRLHLFHQLVGQGDAETLEDIPPQVVGVLEVEF